MHFVKRAFDSRKARAQRERENEELYATSERARKAYMYAHYIR